MLGTPRGLKLVGVLILAVGVFALSEGAPKPAFAQSTWIMPVPVTTFIVDGIFRNTGATLTEAIPANPAYVDIHISDQSYLREGWVVKVGSEKMLVRFLIDGGVGNPDTMSVYRGWEGTYSAAHSQGSNVNGPSVTVDIWAKDVSDSYGLGAFQVQVTLPEQVELIKFLPQSTWLNSTGRTANCFGASEVGPSSWEVHCFTWGDPDPDDPSWYPPGPNGSGIIAKLTVIPPESGTATVDLDGSFLLNVVSDPISSLIQDMGFRVIDCPDVDLNRIVNTSDALQTARAWGDRGRDCGVTLWSASDTSQTTLEVNDQSLAWWNSSSCAGEGTNRPSHIAIDNEIMSVGTFTENGQPDTVSVTRAVYASWGALARAHQAGKHVYLVPSQWDGNYDGRNLYTPTRDVDHNNMVATNDTFIIASVFGMQCP